MSKKPEPELIPAPRKKPIDPEEFENVKKDVSKILDLLEAKNGQPNGTPPPVAPSAAPPPGPSSPNGYPGTNFMPQQNGGGQAQSGIGSLLELAKLLNENPQGQGLGASGLAEQLLLMQAKAMGDLQSTLNRIALDSLARNSPPRSP